MSKPNSVQGRCYCGAIQFELTFPTEFCCHCHCEDCRGIHGAAFVTWTAVPLNQFRFTSGEDKLKRHQSHPGVHWGFCSVCGTSFLGQYDDAPDKIYITVANLTGPLDQEPDAHVSFEEKVPWLEIKDGLPHYRAKTKERI
jgi:hypothetical protein